MLKSNSLNFVKLDYVKIALNRFFKIDICKFTSSNLKKQKTLIYHPNICGFSKTKIIADYTSVPDEGGNK